MEAERLLYLDNTYPTGIMQLILPRDMMQKINQWAQKKYVLFGVPLLCGAIIGTTITLSIPHVKAFTITGRGWPINSSQMNKANVNATVQTPTAVPTQKIVTPTAIPVTTSVQPTSTTSQPSPTVAPCK